MPERPPDPDLERSTNRWMAWGLALLAAAVVAFPLYRLYEPSSREEARELHLASLADQGASLYQTNCSSCHGADGLGGVGPALYTKQFLAADDRQIRQLIAVGVPGSPMNAYSLDFGGPFTLEQIDALTVFLRSLEETAADFPGWRDPLNNVPVALPLAAVPVPEPPEDEGADGGEDPVAIGEAVFSANCAACHGSGLEGLVGPALGPGSDASTLSDADLTATITGGRNAMPAFGGVLEADDIAAVVAYLRDVQG